VEGSPEQARVLLSSVPYAMKWADAELQAGHAASDFVTQEQFALSGAQSGQTRVQAVEPNTSGTVTGSGTAGTLPLWTGANAQGGSTIVQVGTDIGINELAPEATLDVGGAENVRVALTLPALATATATAGQRSQLVQFSASAWSATSNAPVTPTFRLLTNIVGNNTANASGQLELHFQQGTSSTSVLSIAANGVISFAPGQKFPGTGTISGVTAGTGLTGGGSRGALTLAVDKSLASSLAASNLFSSPQAFAAGLTIAGSESITGSEALTGNLNVAGFATISNNAAASALTVTGTSLTAEPVVSAGGGRTGVQSGGTSIGVIGTSSATSFDNGSGCYESNLGPKPWGPATEVRIGLIDTERGNCDWLRHS
jgi:hypothetical protein